MFSTHGSPKITGINQRSFYLVWNTTVGGLPRIKYDSFLQAEHAAKEMAKQHPGNVFTVVKAVSSWTVPVDGILKINHDPESKTTEL